MSSPWTVLAARARGLTTHLLEEDRLDALARAPDPRAAFRLLRESAYAPFLPTRDVSPEGLDVAVARSLAHRLGLLARWCGEDRRALAPIFLDLDARSVRALLRGAGGVMGSERRLAATLPTPSLDHRALETLSRADSAGSIAATLTAWGHPFGPPLLEEAGRARPDVFRLELTLTRTFAQLALAEARRGGRPMIDFVRTSIAAHNIVNAVLLAGVRTESSAGDFFVPGAGRPDPDTFERAVAAETRGACVTLLRSAMADTLFEPALAESRASPVPLSRAILDGRIARLVRARRERPMSAVPVLLFLLRVQRESVLVRRAVWSSAVRAGGSRRSGGSR